MLVVEERKTKPARQRIPPYTRGSPTNGQIIAPTAETSLTRLRVVIQRDTHRTAVVSAVLADDLARGQLPEACVVVTADSDQVCRVGRKRAVPHPALVVSQRGLEV